MDLDCYGRQEKNENTIMIEVRLDKTFEHLNLGFKNCLLQFRPSNIFY
jgi:hypothetical protein